MTFKQRRYECAKCGESVKALAWNYDPAPEHCGELMHETGMTGDRAPFVQDDAIEGGARWCETMGHEPVWLDGTRSQWQREVTKRGLIPMGDRKPAHYFAKQRRLRDEERRDTGTNREY